MAYQLSREMQRAGGYASVAKQGREVVAARARQGLFAKYLREVDPDGILSDAERYQRAEDLQRSRMIVLSQMAAARRKARKMAEANARIRAIANPPTACGNHGPLPHGVSHRTCDECATKYTEGR